MMKKCNKCGQIKDIDLFGKVKWGKDGHDTICKECVAERKRKNNIKNKEKIQAYSKKYRIEHLEELNEYGRNYSKTHRKENNLSVAMWRKNNPEKARNACKKSYLKNIDYYRNKSIINYNLHKEENKNDEEYLKRSSAKAKRYRLKNKDNINFKIINNLRGRIRCAMNGKNKSNSTEKLIGCTIDEFKKHIESLFEPGMSWDNYGKTNPNKKTWHIDHILPCDAFELQNSEEQEICFAWWNMQPMWAIDNIKKRNKII